MSILTDAERYEQAQLDADWLLELHAHNRGRFNPSHLPPALLSLAWRLTGYVGYFGHSEPRVIKPSLASRLAAAIAKIERDISSGYQAA